MKVVFYTSFGIRIMLYDLEAIRIIRLKKISLNYKLTI